MYHASRIFAHNEGAAIMHVYTSSSSDLLTLRKSQVIEIKIAFHAINRSGNYISLYTSTLGAACTERINTTTVRTLFNARGASTALAVTTASVNKTVNATSTAQAYDSTTREGRPGHRLSPCRLSPPRKTSTRS